MEYFTYSMTLASDLTGSQWINVLSGLDIGDMDWMIDWEWDMMGSRLYD